MSQAFQIRRRGQVYLAPDRASLIAWIHQGRVRLDDEVRAHGGEGAEWRRFEEVEELKALFPYAECHMVRRGGQLFKAHELSLIFSWARAGKVSLSDELYIPSEGAWRAVSSHPELRGLIEARHAQSGAPQVPAVFPLTQLQIAQLVGPLYDFARLYLAYRALPPASSFQAPARLESLEVDLTGLGGRAAFEVVTKQLHAHHQGPLTLYSRESSRPRPEAQRAALVALEQSTAVLLQALMSHIKSIGKERPARLLVGGDLEALRHPDEREALELLYRPLAEVIKRAYRLKQISPP